MQTQAPGFKVPTHRHTRHKFIEGDNKPIKYLIYYLLFEILCQFYGKNDDLLQITCESFDMIRIDVDVSQLLMT